MQENQVIKIHVVKVTNMVVDFVIMNSDIQMRLILNVVAKQIVSVFHFISPSCPQPGVAFISAEFWIITPFIHSFIRAAEAQW